jgi:hypothetical protein
MDDSEFVILTHKTGISPTLSFLSRAPKAAGLSKIKVWKEQKEKERKRQIQPKKPEII